MSEHPAVGTTSSAADAAGPFTIYCAGGLFTQDELTTNILIKEAVWRLSGGKYRLFLPQSRELQELDRPDVEAYIRNTDLMEVIQADIILARFDGLELDSGTVIEFAVAKTLGKPAVILRCDLRRYSGTGLSEPYNLMVKNWPRTVEVRLNSYELWAGLFAEERRGSQAGNSFQAKMTAELSIAEKSVNEIARRVITGLDAVVKLGSPFPPEIQESVYKAVRYSVGSGFDELMTTQDMKELVKRLRNNGTL